MENDEKLADVLRIVHERLADPADASFWWPLCVMRACYFPQTWRDLMQAAPSASWAEISETHRAIFGNFHSTEKENAFSESALSSATFDGIFTAARAIAEARAPDHPWIRRLAAYQDWVQERTDLAGKITALESAIRDGLEDDRSANILMGAYLDADGVEEALKRSMPPLPSGLWCFNFVTNSEDYLEEAIDALPEERREAAMRDLLALKQKYYERGRDRMERFFETGEGHPYDASLHLYSMMLHNLARVYLEIGRNEEAIQLNRRGIDVFPFGEHYHNIFLAYLNLTDHENVVQAAEDLWQYAAEHGYDAHDPTDYVRQVAEALYKIEQAWDIPMWLERLTRWEREVARMDENDLPEEALYSRLIVALYMAAVDDNKEISLAVWQRIATQVHNSESVRLWRWAADLLRSLALWEEAIHFYERDLAVEYSEKGAEFLARCQKKLAEKNAPSKRWWQIWK